MSIFTVALAEKALKPKKHNLVALINHQDGNHRPHTRGQDEHPDDPKYHVSHWGMWMQPDLIIQHLWDVFKGAGGYVIWNYTQFYEHFVNWKDGTVTGLLGNIDFAWRALVTALLTLALVEVMPLIEGMGRLLWDIGYVLKGAFGLAETAVNEIFTFLSVVWRDIESVIERFTG